MAWIPFQGNSLVADTSSLIYLAKGAIIRPFVRFFQVTMPPSVYQESICEGYPDSEEIRRLVREGLLTIQPVRENPHLNLELPKGGERDVIVLFYQLGTDGILIDDGAGVKACRKRDIPFLSALLVPSILLLKRAIGGEEAESSLNKIEKIGRYSQEVILFARTYFSQVRRTADETIERRQGN
jgi:hypothetical protein